MWRILDFLLYLLLKFSVFSILLCNVFTGGGAIQNMKVDYDEAVAVIVFEQEEGWFLWSPKCSAFFPQLINGGYGVEVG